jgi:hypothetical protein
MNNTTTPAKSANPQHYAYVAPGNQIPVAVARLTTLMGQFVILRTVRDVKVRKGTPGHYQKDSTFTCRAGVNYDNIGAVKEKRESGELPAENAGLPWGEWLIFPYLIRHNGAHYFRCTSVNNNPVCVPTVRFLRNGVEVSKDEVRAIALASEFREEETPRDVFTVKVENITHINGNPV